MKIIEVINVKFIYLSLPFSVFFDQATVLYSEVPAFCRESKLQYQAPEVFLKSFKCFFQYS